MSARQTDNDKHAVLELKVLTEKILESQIQIQQDVSEIKKSIFDPDEGLYARVLRNTQFRTSASRWMWILTTGLTLYMLNVLVKIFIR